MNTVKKGRFFSALLYQIYKWGWGIRLQVDEFMDLYSVFTHNLKENVA